MKSYLSMVAEFHKSFRQHQPEPVAPTFDHATNTLRVSLIREELRELQSAIVANDRVEILDALCDSQYVLSGSVLAWGLRPLFENIKIVCEPKKIPDMERHLVTMLGLLPQLEAAAEMEFGAQVLTHLQLLQSKLSRLVFHFGFERFSDAFAAVHENNMQKIWPQEAVTAWCYASNFGGDRLSFEETIGGFLARNQSGKVIKPTGFGKVDLRRYV